MNGNETRTLWISVMAALFAVFLLYSYTQEKSDALNKQYGAKQKVVVAKQDINEMETIDDSMLETREQPTAYVQPQALEIAEKAIGQVALAPIKAGEQLLESKIMKPGPVTGLSLQVSPSKRAITIPIDEMRGVAKLVKPGDRIDLVAALDVGKGPTQRREVKTIMQDVVILATGLRIVNELPRIFERSGKDEFIKNYRSDTKFASITIEASPKEAQNLIYILSTSPGSLFVTLRHPSDAKKSPMPAATISSVLGQAARPTIRKQLRKPAARPKPKAKPRKKRRSGGFEDI